MGYIGACTMNEIEIFEPEEIELNEPDEIVIEVQ